MPKKFTNEEIELLSESPYVKAIRQDRLVLTQEIYNTFINNHLFSASINYTNEITGMLLYYSLKKSFETN